MDKFKKESQKHIGPGGYKCGCCGPITSKDKKVLRRRVRRKIKKDLD